MSERKRKWVTFLLAVGLGGLTLTVILPAIGRLSAVRNWNGELETWDIDPGALFYTDVPQTFEAETVIEGATAQR